MSSKPEAEPSWGSQYRLIASEKWKAKSAAMGQPVTDALVDYAKPSLGMQVLDLASGTGEPAISLAVRVGAQGHVTALDLSADLLEIAEKRARTRGLDNFTARQADAHALPFPDNSFDLAACRFGVMFFADPAVSFANLRKALRATGRMAFACWREPRENPWMMTPLQAVYRHVPKLPQPGPEDPGPFSFASQQRVNRILNEAGFTAVVMEPCDLSLDLAIALAP